MKSLLPKDKISGYIITIFKFFTFNTKAKVIMQTEPWLEWVHTKSFRQGCYLRNISRRATNPFSRNIWISNTSLFTESVA